MDTGVPLSRSRGFDAKVMSDVRWTARQLARSAAVAGMDAQDFEQEILLDLWRRQAKFDPSKASYRTFANRVISHCVSALITRSMASTAARKTVSWDALIDEPGAHALLDELSDSLFSNDTDDRDLGIDVRRFFGRLSPAMQRICAVMLTGNLSEGSRLSGLHRSSVYEALRRLRTQASEAGLREYVSAPRQFGAGAGK